MKNLFLAISLVLSLAPMSFAAGTGLYSDVYRNKLQKVLSYYIGDEKSGWEAGSVDKPAFPFVVEKQGDIWAGIADKMIDVQQKTYENMLVKDSIQYSIFNELLNELGIQEPHPGKDSNEFAAFSRRFKSALQKKSNFVTSGTLVVVGWGSGDSESVSGSVPAGGTDITQKLSSTMSYQIETEDAIFNYLEANRKAIFKDYGYTVGTVGRLLNGYGTAYDGASVHYKVMKVGEDGKLTVESLEFRRSYVVNSFDFVSKIDESKYPSDFKIGQEANHPKYGKCKVVEFLDRDHAVIEYGYNRTRQIIVLKSLRTNCSDLLK